MVIFGVIMSPNKWFFERIKTSKDYLSKGHAQKLGVKMALKSSPENSGELWKNFTEPLE